MCSVENKAEDRDILSQENMRLLARSRALVTAGIPEYWVTGMPWGCCSASCGCAQCVPQATQGTVSGMFSVHVCILKTAHILNLWARPVTAETVTWEEDTGQTDGQDFVR